MPALLERPDPNSVFSLWTKTDTGWHHLDTSTDQSALRLKVQSLKQLFTNKQFLIVRGASLPPANQ